MTTKNSASSGSITNLVQAGVITGDVNVFGTPAPVLPHNMPSTTRHFVGRRADLDRLTRLARADGGSRVCLVDGAPGMGKTAFALRWGDLARSLFPDGQVYLDLRGFDTSRPPVGPEAAIRMVLDALHVPARLIPLDLDGQHAFFRTFVDERRMLLIIDNAQDSDQVRPLLPGSSRCFTVVTARHRLDGLVLHHGAERVTLDRLDDHDAVELLEKHMGVPLVAEERSAVDRVSAVCAGHPLALSMVAAKAAVEGASSLLEVSDQLGDGSSALDAFDLADTVDIRAVFALSYDHLPVRLATSFRDLTLHAGVGIDARSAAAMTTTADVRRARGVLAELTRRHLLERNAAGQYAFHSLTRIYGSEVSQSTDTAAHRRAVVRAWLNHQLHAAAGADRLINAHRRPVALELCERPELLQALTSRADAVAWFSLEYENVLAAITTAIAERMHVYTWQLAWVMSNFAYSTARWRDWIGTHVEAIDAARNLADRPVEARLWQSLARAYSESGAHRQSVDGYRTALVILDEVDDPLGRANALNGLSGAELRSGAYEHAVETGLRALELYSRFEDEAGTAGTYSILGRACSAKGKNAEAMRYHQLARALYDKCGNLYGLAHVSDSLAGLELARNNSASAVRHLHEAIVFHHTVGNRNHAVRSCRNLRALLRGLGRSAAEVVGLDHAISFLKKDAGATPEEFANMVEQGGWSSSTNSP